MMELKFNDEEPNKPHICVTHWEKKLHRVGHHPRCPPRRSWAVNFSANAARIGLAASTAWNPRDADKTTNVRARPANEPKPRTLAAPAAAQAEAELSSAAARKPDSAGHRRPGRVAPVYAAGERRR
jgi:hypothetical protein